MELRLHILAFALAYRGARMGEAVYRVRKSNPASDVFARLAKAGGSIC